MPAGHFADNFNRKKIILITTLVLATASLGLTLIFSVRVERDLDLFFPGRHRRGADFSVAGQRGVRDEPCSARTIFPRRDVQQRHVSIFLRRSARWRSAARSSFSPHQFATSGVVGLCTERSASLACFALVMPIKHIHKVKPAEPVSVKSLVEGFKFVYRK